MKEFLAWLAVVAIWTALALMTAWGVTIFVNYLIGG